MSYKSDFVITDEIVDTMSELDKGLLELVEQHIQDDDSAIAVGSILLKYAISVFGGVLAHEELTANLEYMATVYDSIEPIIPPNRKIN
jgi:hypothetical protein